MARDAWRTSLATQSKRQQFGDMADEMHLEFVAHFLGDVAPVWLIAFGQNYGLDPEPRGSQYLFLDTSNPHNAPSEADFAGHCYIRPDALPGQQRGQRRNYSNAGAWAVFRCGACGHMDVN